MKRPTRPARRGGRSEARRARRAVPHSRARLGAPAPGPDGGTEIRPARGGAEARARCRGARPAPSRREGAGPRGRQRHERRPTQNLAQARVNSRLVTGTGAAAFTGPARVSRARQSSMPARGRPASIQLQYCRPLPTTPPTPSLNGMAIRGRAPPCSASTSRAADGRRGSPPPARGPPQPPIRGRPRRGSPSPGRALLGDRLVAPVAVVARRRTPRRAPAGRRSRRPSVSARSRVPSTRLRRIRSLTDSRSSGAPRCSPPRGSRPRPRPRAPEGRAGLAPDPTACPSMPAAGGRRLSGRPGAPPRAARARASDRQARWPQ